MPESTEDLSSCQEFANNMESFVGGSLSNFEPEPEPVQDTPQDDKEDN